MLYIYLLSYIWLNLDDANRYIMSASGYTWGKTEFLGWGGCCSGVKNEMSDNFMKVFHGIDNSETLETKQQQVQNPILSKGYDTLTAPLIDILQNVVRFPQLDLWSLDVSFL